ncbi:MAG: hypothetical protein ACOC5J_01960, partial [Gemmatimonadota bacterium]
PEHTSYDEASWFMVGPLLVTAAVGVLVGVQPDAFFHFFSLAADTMASVMPDAPGSVGGVVPGGASAGGLP